MAQSADFNELDPYAAAPPANFWGGGPAAIVPKANPPGTQLADLFRAVNPSQVSTAAQQSSGGYAQAGDPFPNVPYTGNPEAYARSLFSTVGRGAQTDPTALNKILAGLNHHGVNATLDSRNDQYHKGIMLNGQFVKMLDGMDNWTWLPGGDAPSGQSPTAGVADQMFTDPASQMFQSMVLKRIDDLMQSINRPEQDAYRKAALARVDQLQQPPYSAADEQALITRMREPLTQARDARMAFNKEQMGGRNILPSSGLFQDQVFNTPNRDYERALAGGTNDLAVQAIGEKSSRQNQALGILSDLVGLGQNNRNETNAQADKALTAGAILPDMSERRLQLLMQSLGMSDAAMPSLLSTMTNLNAQNQQASQFAAGQRNNNAAAIGQIIGYLTNSGLLNPATWRG